MLDSEEIYVLKVFDLEKGCYEVNGSKYSSDDLRKGVALRFKNLETKKIEIINNGKGVSYDV
jgi:hypothetical protein